jgi:hypothetical protein
MEVAATEIIPEPQESFIKEFNGDEGLEQYGSNALLVYAAAMYCHVDDRDELAAEALTDGNDDKKIDFLHIDYGERRAVLGQGYLARDWGKKEAPANKASDLNTAISWIASGREEQIPDSLLPKILEVRDAVENDLIDRFELIFVHNAHESENVRRDLETASKQAAKVFKNRDIEWGYTELGLEAIETLYLSQTQ